MSGSPFRTLSPSTSGRRNSQRAWMIVRFCASALLATTGAIHLDLYLTGYETIPTIGWLFLLQFISAFALAIAVVVSARRIISVAGAGFLMSTLVGYLVSLRVGLFGFREVRTDAGIFAGVIDVVGFATLASITLRPSRRSNEPDEPIRVPRPIINQRVAMLAGRWVAGVLTVQAAVTLGLVLSDTVAPAAAVGPNVLVKVTQISGVAVLTNAKGDTLYWFAPDTSSSSRCYATCAAYWPPVIGTPIAGAGVTGSLATLKRTNGAIQATYDGHPLYTYVGDASPGQASGNHVRLNGGWWYEMKVSN